MLSARITSDPENPPTTNSKAKSKLGSPARRTPNSNHNAINSSNFTGISSLTSLNSSSSNLTNSTGLSSTNSITRRLPLADRSNQRSTPNRSIKSPLAISTGLSDWNHEEDTNSHGDKNLNSEQRNFDNTNQVNRHNTTPTIIRRTPLAQNLSPMPIHVHSIHSTLSTPSRRNHHHRSNNIPSNVDQSNSANVTTTSWYELPDPSGQTRIRELQTALRETLEENRQIHERCEILDRENGELRVQLKEMDVISMLYETAKREIEELSTALVKLQLSASCSCNTGTMINEPTKIVTLAEEKL